MRKINCLIALALATSAPLFASCDDDDDDNKTNYKELTLITDFDLDFENDFLQLCDVTVSATDFNGNTRTVDINTPDWEEKLQTTVFPASCSYKVNIARKPNVTLTKATYDLDCDISFEADSYIGTTKTVVVPDNDIILSTAENVPAASVDAEIDRIIANANSASFSYTFSKSASGAIIPSKIEN